MPNISSIIKNVRNIMRQDRGVSGDAQRLEQLGWLLFLKILDDKDQELELIRDRYQSVIPEKFQWRNWAANAEGITGEELILFIDHPTDGLFATLKNLKAPHAPQRAALVKEVFDGSNNYMKSGYELRKVINQLNGFDFNNSDDRHVFGTVYESILVELRDAGNKGEYYTPRAITQLMTQMTAPRLGERVLDPAAGTGGFLSAAIDYIREKEVRTLDDEAILQKSITGWELKPVSYVLGLTNLILHGLDVPDWHYLDSLKTEYNTIGPKQQVECILANPPFGASIADGVETNFPQSFRCRESADLFVILMIQLLKPGGRCAIVLPDGCITGDGYKERIREKLLTDCNLHTIVRLPVSTFHPAAVPTNLLFFQKGTRTKEIWYYEHRLPEGQKSYSKLKQIQFEEFAPMIAWWNARKENEVAWKVTVEDLKKGFDLDAKNPHSPTSESGCVVSAEANYEHSVREVKRHCEELAAILEPIGSNVGMLAKNPSALFFNPKELILLRSHILSFAVDGRLTANWRVDNPDVEDASLLIQRIEAEKARLVATRKIRTENPVPEIDLLQIPFEIPKTWEWCSSTFPAYLIPDRDKKIPTSQILSAGKFPVVDQGKVLIRGFTDNAECVIELDGPIVLFGDHTREAKYIDFNFVVGADGVKLLRPILVSPKYYHLAISSVRIEAKNYARHFKFLKESFIPLPPLAEQAAIVERVEALMTTCRALEAEIEHARTHAAHLLQAVLKEAFAPAAS